MLVGDFQSSLSSYVQKEDFNSAHDVLMNEIGRILVRDKQDFIDMLNESDVEADISMSDTQLVEMFVDNVDNRKMLLGASLLTQIHNKKMGFDGDDEISDDGVKTGYAVMNTYFNFDDEEDLSEDDFSYAGGIWGTLFQGAKKLLGGRKKKGKNSKQDSKNSERKLMEAARLERERQEQIRIAEQKKKEEEKKRKKTTNILIIVSSVLVVGIITTILIFKRRK